MKKEKSGCARIFMIIVCIVLGLILAAMITVTVAGTAVVNHFLNMVNRAEDLPQETLSQEQIEDLFNEETVAPEEDTAPVVKEEDVDWGQQDGTVIENSDNIVNILLIGQDARPGEGRSRSDSMILVTFNKAQKTITMTSFLRDLYVQIPGYADNKLNATYVLGGMELLNDTLEQNFGVQVDGNVEVDFSHFADVIDLLGGVDMELRNDEAAYINAYTGRYVLGSGLQHLDGEQALFYSRIRHLDADADFSRTNRQRKVINALIEQFRSTKLTTLLGLLDDLLPMITTDLTNKEMIQLAKDLFPMLADCTIVSQRVPADGAYYLASINSMSCIVADMDAARELLKQTMSD